MAGSTEIVPGMAEAIEHRRKEKGLNKTQFASAAGVTLQGLSPLLKGYRRRYQDSLKLGVARALDWPFDAVDRLLNGQMPNEWPELGLDYTPETLNDAAGVAVARLVQRFTDLGLDPDRAVELVIEMLEAADAEGFALAADGNPADIRALAPEHRRARPSPADDDEE